MMEFYSRHNNVIGTVIGCNSYGCYVRDNNLGKVVFYYGNGMIGDKVQLTVKSINYEAEKVTCILDSVLEYADFVA